MRIGELILEDFRGFRGRHRVSFIDGINVIHGPVGSGKSSVIQAIEYAIYGNQLEVKERISKLADLINEDSGRAVVRLTLTGASIMRELRRIGDSVREYMELIIDGSTISDEDEARSRLMELLGIDEEDFERFILVTHRTLEGFIYGAKTRRNILIDKLFGLEILENIRRAIPMAQLERMINELRYKLASLSELPQVLAKYGSVERARARLEELRSSISELRREEEELSLEYSRLLEERGRIMASFRNLEELYRDYTEVRLRRSSLEGELRGEGPSEVSVRILLEQLRDELVNRLEEYALVSDADELGGLAVRDMGEALLRIYEGFRKLVRLREKLIEDRDELLRARSDLSLSIERLKVTVRELELRLNQLEPSLREYLSIIEPYGNINALRAKVEEARVRARETKLREALIEVIKHALMEARTGRTQCPVCGRSIRVSQIEEKLRELERAVSEDLGLGQLEEALRRAESLKPLVDEYDALSARLRETKSQLESLTDRLESIEKTLRDLERRIERLGTFLEGFKSKLDNADSMVATLRKRRELEELRKKERELLSKLSSAGFDVNLMNEIEGRIRHVEDRLMRVRVRLREDSAELSRLELALSKLGPGDDPSLLRRRLEYLEDLYSRLGRIKDGLRDVQGKAREIMVKRIRDNVDEIFKFLYPYPDLSGAGIEIDPEGGDYVLYAVRRGRRVPVPRLSDGQRLALALSFILAVNKSTRHNVEFLLMDEPIPYVDSNMREAFAKLLSQLVRGGFVRQVIIATQSEELVNDIVRELGNASKVIRIIKEGGERRILEQGS